MIFILVLTIGTKYSERITSITHSINTPDAVLQKPPRCIGPTGPTKPTGEASLRDIVFVPSMPLALTAWLSSVICHLSSAMISSSLYFSPHANGLQPRFLLIRGPRVGWIDQHLVAGALLDLGCPSVRVSKTIARQASTSGVSHARLELSFVRNMAESFRLGWGEV